MELIGIIKEIDKLGRIVIPKPLRDRYELDDKVEIIATKKGILIKKTQSDIQNINKPSDI